MNIQAQSFAAWAIVIFSSGVSTAQQRGDASAVVPDATTAIEVDVDRAKLVTLPNGRSRIVLSDPTILHVTRLSDGSHVILTGVVQGESAITVHGRDGSVLMKSKIRVGENVVTVFKGDHRNTYYNCSRLCQPGEQAGDISGENIGGRNREGQGISSTTNSTNPTTGASGGL